MKKRIFIICILLYNILFINRVYSCSIFYAAIGSTILAGNSEDWNDINSMIKFIPPQNGKYGRIVYGFKDWGLDFCPWGGVNDQGLFYDWADVGPRDPDFRAKGTIPYNGVLADKMEEECATVDEAIALFKKYSCPGFGGAHILIGDRFGNSVVIEESENNTLTFIRKKNNYQVAENFLNSYLDDPKIYRWIQCPRYKYIDETLKDKDSITVGLFGDILQHVGSNRTLSPTVYSNIYDLNVGKVYIYNYYNFDEVLIVDVKKELEKGYQFYKLPELFSGIKANFPASNANINSSSVEFRWTGNATNYEIWISKDEQFTNPQIINYSKPQSQKAEFGLLYIIIIISIIMLRFKKSRSLALTWVFGVLLLGGCEKTELPESTSKVEHIITIDNFEPHTKYYWKVLTNNSNGLNTETKLESFTTSDF
jgi:hypothetical protein